MGLLYTLNGCSRFDYRNGGRVSQGLLGLHVVQDSVRHNWGYKSPKWSYPDCNLLITLHTRSHEPLSRPLVSHSRALKGIMIGIRVLRPESLSISHGLYLMHINKLWAGVVVGKGDEMISEGLLTQVLECFASSLGSGLKAVWVGLVGVRGFKAYGPRVSQFRV